MLIQPSPAHPLHLISFLFVHAVVKEEEADDDVYPLETRPAPSFHVLPAHFFEFPLFCYVDDDEDDDNDDAADSTPLVKRPILRRRAFREGVGGSSIYKGEENSKKIIIIKETD